MISYAQSLSQFVWPIVQLGLNAVLVYEIINHPEKEGEIVGTSLILSILSATVSAGGIIGFSFLANRGEKETIIVCALYSISLFFHATETIVYWFQAKYLSKYTAMATFIAYIAMSAYKIYLLATAKNIFWFAVAQSFDYLIVSVFLFIVYKNCDGQKLGFSFEIAKRILSSGKYYVLSGIMVTIFAQTDRIMIKIMYSNEETGLYSVAVNCATLFNFVFGALVNAFRPNVLEKKKLSQKEYEDSVIKLYSIVNYLSLLQTVVLFVGAKLLITVIYGNEYFGAVLMLRIIVWYTTFSYFGAAKDVWILAEGKQKYLLILNASGAAANVLLNLMLIPFFGGAGAATASLITQIFTNVIMCLFIKPLRRNAYLFVQSLNPFVLYKCIKNYIKTQ